MKNTEEYPKIKRRFKKFNHYLPFRIEGESYTLEKHQVDSPEHSVISRADDEVMIYDFIETSFGSNLSVGKTLIAIFTVGYLIALIAGENLIYGLLLNLIGLFFIIRAYTLPDQRIILDRKNGLFTYPGFAWNKPVTIPFDEAAVAVTYRHVATAPGPPELTAYHPNGITGAYLCGYKQIQTWWFFVWYMDRNRPLPPGTAFDPYRQKDYERRKAEGFPPPLYESAVPTPEATPEQQREREKYWQSDAELLDTKLSSILPQGLGPQRTVSRSGF